MKYLRNKEEKRFFFSLSFLSLLAISSNFLINRRAGVITLLICCAFSLTIYLYNRTRYQKIEELTNQIDEMLHGNQRLELHAEEGELAILSSQIAKMTVRLQEQSSSLKKEKEHLSSSLTDIAHQLRTPLTTLTMIGDFLSEPELSEQRRQELTRELLNMLKRMDQLITILLKIAKLEGQTVQYQPQKILIHELLTDSLQPFLIPLELKEMTVQLQGDHQAGLSIDASWTQEAIGNIIKNCIEHSEDGSILTLSYEQNALYTEITLSDTGKGIDSEDLPHIFERFYQGKNHHKNSFGVGLSLARMIITQQGGSLTAKNQQSGGALFTIRFYEDMLK
ncbi:sensor histidine kinase [Enterococcus sp. BWR-S5]|uniref:sensor histidine kinase n=1 Tax=Enterococcus sp. BWR-S5 TaxID=2787714 RepID=UPI00192203F7|nr:HAMP domain-containing sensor histidine kinase [Enterococcus sp. BWR-S5]MBL1226883.1 HAMP domain-containing histidine kinase [Enterococcus sp. BWR-S5]